VCRFDQFFIPARLISDQDKLLTELKRTHLDDSPSVAGPVRHQHGPSITAIRRPAMRPTLPGHDQHQGQPTQGADDAVYAARNAEDRGRDRRKMILLISDGVNGKKSNTYDTTRAERTAEFEHCVYGRRRQRVFDRRFDGSRNTRTIRR